MNQPVPWVATALLAGGQSRRMGRPKPLLPVPHQTLLAGHVDSAASLHRPVLLCSDRLDYRAVVAHPCVHIHDHISQAGPLAALAGAMHWCRQQGHCPQDWLAVLSVDGLLQAADLLAAVQTARQAQPALLDGGPGAVDVVHLACGDTTGGLDIVPAGQPEPVGSQGYPLLGLYRLSLLEALLDCLPQARRVMRFVQAQNRAVIGVAAHWQGRLNLNTPADYEALLRQLGVVA